MNFQTTSILNSEQKSRIINANSWSACLAYLEGTGEEINTISILKGDFSVIVNDPSSSNCFYVLLQDNVTTQNSAYLIFDTNLSNIQTWISQQTGKTAIGINLSEKTYVAV